MEEVIGFNVCSGDLNPQDLTGKSMEWPREPTQSIQSDLPGLACAVRAYRCTDLRCRWVGESSLSERRVVHRHCGSQVSQCYCRAGGLWEHPEFESDRVIRAKWHKSHRTSGSGLGVYHGLVTKRVYKMGAASKASSTEKFIFGDFLNRTFE